MTEREAIDQLIANLKERRANGQQMVPIEGMTNFLLEHQKSFSSGPRLTLPEYMELHSAYTLAQYNAEVDCANRLFESVIAASKEAIRSLFLINGGGCVALLALMGQVAAKIGGGTAIAPTFGVALLGFAGGLFSATLLACLAYLGQAARHAKKNRLGNAIQWAAIVVAIVSLGAFIFGCWSAFLGISQMHFTASDRA